MRYTLLPIGTVVEIKDEGTQKFMIVGYFPTNMEGEQRDYTAVTYPMGVYDNRLFYFFNHDDIKEKIHMGYVNNDFEVMCSIIDVNYKKLTKTGQDEGEV